jgi:hypothetical protein
LSRGKRKIFFGFFPPLLSAIWLSAAQVKLVSNNVEREGSETAGGKISPYRGFGGRCGKQWHRDQRGHPRPRITMTIGPLFFGKERGDDGGHGIPNTAQHRFCLSVRTWFRVKPVLHQPKNIVAKSLSTFIEDCERVRPKNFSYY